MLLKKLDDGQLDFALIEGYFDKSKYNYKLFKRENFLGICSINHKFSNNLNYVFLKDVSDSIVELL